MDLRKDILYYDALVDFPANGQENKLYLNKADGALYYWDGAAYQLAGDGSGGVTSVTASAPLASSGGATPNITLTVPGNTTTFLRGDGTFATPPTSSTGRFGIADSTGTYTYYTTLAAAITAATAGQTVEFFTDYTETGAVTIRLKDGVTINGNGHTYFHTQAGSSNSFDTDANAGTFKIFNLNINRTNATGGYVLVSGGGVYAPLQVFYLNGSVITCNNSGIFTSAIYTTRRFYNGNVITTGSGTAIIPAQDGMNIYNFSIRGTSTSTGSLCNTILLYNSNIVNEGSGVCLANSSAYNSSIVATGGGHTVSQCQTLSNCSIYNYANLGNHVNCLEFNNCVIYSATTYGAYTEATTYFRNCTVISAVNYAAVNGIHSNNSIVSLAGRGAAYSILNNSYVSSLWNNAGGHAYEAISTSVIKNSILKVTNASANCIYSASPITIKYAQNTFESATTSVNANITQGMVNTEDTYGNITI